MPSHKVHSLFVEPGFALAAPAYLARKRAFLIGIEYGNIHGAHEDVQRFQSLLVEKFGFQSDDTIMMLDDGVNLEPTKANIMAVLEGFLVGQHPGDLFVFVYAGHAKQSVCLDGSERDNLDESIMTCDERRILDDDLNRYLVERLRPGSTLLAFFDACHSETLFEPPYLQ
ncbi:peptidase C14, caspase domain-containing protein [Mycena galopus ATCC 62051]|nr:peptidase C14, caspase domain-containing protein [Mycena galopus ATCC 62051]